MELISISDSSFKELPILKQLYETAFPEKERRRFSQLLQMLQEPSMYLHAVKTADGIAGLCVHWQLDTFLYLEHLAILPEHRGKQLGQQVMLWLLQQATEKVVLEVERPQDETSRRRIAFYERLGLTLHPEYDYLQPPYRPNAQPVPLYLMAQPQIASKQEFSFIATTIKEQVYERFYSKGKYQ